MFSLPQWWPLNTGWTVILKPDGNVSITNNVKKSTTISMEVNNIPQKTLYNLIGLMVRWIWVMTPPQVWIKYDQEISQGIPFSKFSIQIQSITIQDVISNDKITSNPKDWYNFLSRLTVFTGFMI